MTIAATAASSGRLPVPGRLRVLARVLAYAALVALCLGALWRADERSLGRSPWANLVKSVGEFSHPSFLDLWFGPERLAYRSDDGSRLRVENRREVEGRFLAGFARATWFALQIATLGSLPGALLALPAGRLPARNLQAPPLLAFAARGLLKVSRALHTLVFGLVLVGLDVVDEMLDACRANLVEAQARNAWFRLCAIKDPRPADGPCVFTGRSAISFGQTTEFDNGKGHRMTLDQPLMKSPFRSLLFVVIAALAAAATWAAEPVSTGLFGSTAIGGKDTVSYHAPAVRQSHRVSEGENRYGVKYLGATWRFATQASADKFAASPAAYVPRYNGHCANALSIGEGLVRTGGQVWDCFGDKLFLFHGEPGRQRWSKGDAQAFEREADEAWQAILQKRYAALPTPRSCLPAPAAATRSLGAPSVVARALCAA